MTLTILIVDDERSGRDTVEAALDGQGYQLEFAEDGPRAVQKARAIHPDVILLDVMMPGMTGFDVCRQLRQDSHFADTPVIFLTALDDQQSLLEALKSGMDDYIVKPFDISDLRTRMRGIAILKRQLTA